MSAQCGIDGTELPSFARKAAQVRNVGNIIDSADIKVETHIVVAKTMAVLKIRVSEGGAAYRIVIVDLRVVPLPAAVRGIQIETLAPSQVVLSIQTVPATLVVRQLHTVVLGGSLISCCDNVANIRKGASKRPELVAVRSGRTIAADGRCI